MIFKARPVFSPRPWGDPRLNELFGVESDRPIGEVWLLSGLEGHESSFSTEAGQPVELTEVVSATGLILPRFPLLIKLISTTDWLSVQVHPNDELATRLENEPWGKNEGWYFLSDGSVALGSITGDELKEALETNTLRNALKTVNVSKNDFLYLPAGILHALGPGTSLLEVQQSSDITYRVFDWGRPRPLHIEKAILAVKPVKTSPKKVSGNIVTPYFTMEFPKSSARVDGFAVVIEEDYSICIVPCGESQTFEKPWVVVRLGHWWYENFPTKRRKGL
ncbi:MAG: class I mannose-6-phosphate isomerase [Thermotogae bacterium]|nr:class I mannose-6-phosphate isomerase [Thermotogota bacterium]